MDQVTQQNAAMVEQSTAASHALAQETEELAGLTATFQTGDVPHGEVNTSKRSPSPAVDKATSLKRPKTVTALKVASQAKPRAVFAIAAQTESWEEY